jgi:long-subunit fatty acid transport protein
MVRAALITIVLLAAVVPAARAQNTENSAAFDFTLPGARSRGIGGAFVAIADDATAVYSNPAGLLALLRPEVSIEGQHLNFKSQLADAGHAFGPATNIGVDTITGLVNRTFESNLNGISFLSFAYPTAKWAVGVFEHQLVRYHMDRQTHGPFYDCRGGLRGTNPMAPYCELSAADGVDRIFPAIQSFDLNIRGGGAAFSYAATRRLSLGVAFEYYAFSLAGENRVYGLKPDTKYQPANFADANLALTGVQNGSDHGFGANIGVKWALSDQWAVGASFRKAPTFHYSVQTTTGPGNSGVSGVTFVNSAADPFHVPDTAALGVAFKPVPVFRVAFEYDRIQYSQLANGLQNTSTPAGDPEGARLLERLRLDDANVARAGGEYVFVVGSTVVALRGGGWYDPPHRLVFQTDNESTGLPIPRWAIYFPETSGSAHGSAGGGVVLRRRLQIDGAVDWSGEMRTYSLSMVWRF